MITRNYWGKAQGSVGDRESGCHLFACHSLDVVAVASAWLARSRALRRAFGGIDDSTRQSLAWVLFFMGLHDLGKLDVRFQAKAPDAIRVLKTYDSHHESFWLKTPTKDYWHGPEGFRWGMAELAGYIGFDPGDEDAWYDYGAAWLPWLAAVTGHHGVLPVEVDRPNMAAVVEDIRTADRLARKEWVSTLEELFLHPAGLSLRDIPPAPSLLLAGLCAVCDWLGSNTGYFPYQTQAGDWEAYLASRRESAERILSDSGVYHPPLARGGMAVLYSDLVPRQLQTRVDDLPIVPGLTLVEAPTGSGKTEAAIAYASRWDGS